MRRVLLSFAALLGGCVSKPSEWQGPPIVHMTCPGVKGVAIIPTMHSYGGPIPPNVQEAVKAADVVFLEFDFRNPKTRISKLLSKRKSVPELAELPTDWFSRLDEDATKRLNTLLTRKGVSVESLKSMKPEDSYMKILELAASDKTTLVKRDFGTDTFDSHIQRFAEKNNVPTSELETVEEFFNDYMDERDSYATDRLGTIAFILKSNEMASRIKSEPNDDYYRNLRLDNIDTERAYAEVLRNTIPREARWLTRLKEQTKGKRRVVIAVGAAHVEIKRGLPAKLASEMDCKISD